MINAEEAKKIAERKFKIKATVDEIEEYFEKKIYAVANLGDKTVCLEFNDVPQLIRNYLWLAKVLLQKHGFDVKIFIDTISGENTITISWE